MVDEKFLHSEITNKIIQAFYTVYNHFRFGYPKSVYLRSILIEMNNLGLICERGKKVKVYYQNQVVGEFETDIVVNNCVAVNIETKKETEFEDDHKIYYFLRASEFEVGLFLNFGMIPLHKRKTVLKNTKEPLMP